MPANEQDDVARLLSATGGAQSSYREFENSGGNSTSAPLIDAVFATNSPYSPPAEQSSEVLPKADLLADVFDQPKTTEAAAQSATAPFLEQVAQHTLSSPITAHVTQQNQRGAPQQLPPLANGSGRSLRDIRRIIATPSDEGVTGPSNESLHGLFDRLAK